MSNEVILKNLQNIYNNLKYFKIENNILILNYQNIYSTPLNYLNLNNINPDIYLINPLEIFQVITLLELLYHPTLNDNEKNFINDYMHKYLLLNEDILNNNSDDIFRFNILNIPIYTCYDEIFINNEASILIQNLINNYQNSSLSNKGSKLALINPLYGHFSNDDDYNNGFIGIILIFITCILTVLYITYFVIK